MSFTVYPLVAELQVNANALNRSIEFDNPVQGLNQFFVVVDGWTRRNVDIKDGVLVNEEWLMAPVTPPLMLAVPPPSIYEVGCPSIAVVERQSFLLPAPGLLIPPSVIEDLSTHLGQVQVMPSQMVHAMDRFEQISTQAAMQQRDLQIQQPQTMVLEMSSRESTLMPCILGIDRRLAELERRPPGPQ
uniref:Uncharacterized protein n=1 Tax=Tanacetum cinerariifolium TaxID=118510 RepID=A0A699I3M3_TANCI|nr:hypothetical protein [Tanacetum cinerariifolium]